MTKIYQSFVVVLSYKKKIVSFQNEMDSIGIYDPWLLH